MESPSLIEDTRRDARMDGDRMATWIRIITFTDEGLKLVRKDPTVVFSKVGDAIQEAGGALKEAYVTLGTFDCVSIIEARDEEHIAEITQRITSSGLYEAVNVAAVPVQEFLEMARRSPVFLKAWLDGRELRIPSGGKSASTGRPSPAKAASPKVERKPGVNTRRGRRSGTGTGLTLALPNLEPSEVMNVSVGPGDADGAFLVRLPPGNAKKAGILDVERNTRIPFVLELVAEKTILNLHGNIVRVDAAEDGLYDVLVLVKDLPRPIVARLDRLTRPR